MINLPLGVKVYIFTKPLDMRRAIDGMASLVQAWNKEKLQSGHLFVFFSRKCDRVKILYWDRNGFALWLKRLERGRFRLPRIQEEVYKLTGTELNLLLEGIDFTSQTENACVIVQARWTNESYDDTRNLSSSCRIRSRNY